jgi:hypothetical protein
MPRPGKRWFSFGNRVGARATTGGGGEHDADETGEVNGWAPSGGRPKQEPWVRGFHSLWTEVCFSGPVCPLPRSRRPGVDGLIFRRSALVASAYLEALDVTSSGDLLLVESVTPGYLIRLSGFSP